jgi:SOS response regulatory protein OraA/RecX
VLDDASDFHNAVRFAGKKRRVIGKYPAAIAKRRLYHLLLRRGYSPEIIMKVLKHETAKEDEQ